MLEKITDLISKYEAERTYYLRELKTSNNNMFWASANRCEDFIEDLQKLKKELEK